jgi:hypothetical protein
MPIALPQVYGGQAEANVERDEGGADPQVPGVRHRADNDEQQASAQELVTSQHTSGVLHTPNCMKYLHTANNTSVKYWTHHIAYNINTYCTQFISGAVINK